MTEKGTDVHGRLYSERVFYCVCAVCDNGTLGGAFTRYYSDAEKHIRSLGWKKRKGLWYCPEHSGVQ
jgi:hypothetical protein